MNIPKGYKLVPVEPAEEMLSALIDTWFAACPIDDQDAMAQAYKSMLAAAPIPPQPIYDEAKERKLFENFAVNRKGGYANLPFFVFCKKDNGEYIDGTSELAWEGWKACAQSRAKSVEE